MHNPKPDLDPFAEDLSSLIEADMQHTSPVSDEFVRSVTSSAFAAASADPVTRSSRAVLIASLFSLAAGVFGAALWTSWALLVGVLLAVLLPVLSKWREESAVSQVSDTRSSGGSLG